MQKQWSARLIGEFLVIVVGVLVALAVDDYRQYRADRNLELYLMDRIGDDLAADEADLEFAKVLLARRAWVIQSVLTDLEDGVADGSPSVPLPDSVLNPEATRRLLQSQGREGGALFEVWDPSEQPFMPFVGTPEFDLSDDTFQEIVMSGALPTLRDRTFREELLQYYRVAEDMGANERREGQYQQRLEEALEWVGVAVGDSIGIIQLAERVSRDPRVLVVMRRSQSNLQMQARFLDVIGEARQRLETARAESRVAS